MSFPTKPAFTYTGNWSEETRSHPAMKWMEEYTRNVIDKRLWEQGGSAGKWHDDNMAVQKSDGTRSSGVDNVWATLASIYGPFGGHKHYPRQISVWETGNGGNLTDGEGDKWDGVGPGAFQFEYVKTADGGIKLKETKLFSDPTPAIKLMLKAGAINGEQLAGMMLSS